MKFATTLQGPDGTGKSFMASTIVKVIESKALVLALDYKETRSWAYQRFKDKIDIELFSDPAWSPSLGTESFKADAYIKVLRRIDELYEDEQYEAIIVDPGTLIRDITRHELMKLRGIAAPGDLPGRGALGFYGDMGPKQAELVNKLLGLTVAKRPKHLIVPWHMQPAREEEMMKEKGEQFKKAHADKKHEGIAYEGGALPVLDGNYKYYVGGRFDVKIWVGKEPKLNKKEKKMEDWYYALLKSEGERECKISVGKEPKESKIDNDFGKLMEAIGL